MLTDQLHAHQDNLVYDAFIQRINIRFNALTGPVFQTDAAGLYEAYLGGFDTPEARQYHTCSCCRHFINKFGGLAVVDDSGQLVPAIWNEDEAPDHYKPAVAAMARLVRRARITMPFLSSEHQYGTAVSRVKATGHEWHHFAIRPAPTGIYRGTALKNAFQAASEKREEMGSVITALGEYSKDTVAVALKLLKDDQLHNSQAAVAQAQFLADLHAIGDKAQGDRATNLVWRAVAAAPSGLCHPRSSMIATLLDDIQAGMTFEQAQTRWNAKMHPLAYQRPQAAPTAGAIKAAEEAFQKLGAASALRRRFARLDDVLEKLWAPRATAAESASSGIFASVKPKGVPAEPMSMRAPAITMTWDKFQRTVLPTADTIEFFAPHGNFGYCALTTAADPDAVPILQWDSVERRNPVALYVWHGGSPAYQFSLTAGQFHKVSAITLRPSMWFGGVGFEHQPQGVVFIIDGAKDMRRGAGCALFPSTLKGEYHGMRSVIEAYSNANEMEGHDEASACGALLGKGDENFNALVRVTSAGQVTEYKLDRWD